MHAEGEGERTTETQQVVARVWREILEIDEVGISDNFFDLGGDSLRALLVVSRLERDGWKVLPSEVLEAETLGETAAALRPAGRERAG